MKRYNVLSIAGVDPSGGAGIEADIKVFSAFGVYGMAVVAGLTAQNTQGVTALAGLNSDFLSKQLNAISSDIKIDSIKIGMLSTTQNIDVVKNFLTSLKSRPPVILDPVMVATSGDRLLEQSAEKALISLATLADIITPNLSELAILYAYITNSSPRTPKTIEEAINQAQELAKVTHSHIYVKGGHFEKSSTADDYLISWSDANITKQLFSVGNVETINTHGTGCTLSSAFAAIYPQIRNWTDTCKIAKNYLTNALRHSDNLQVSASASKHSNKSSDRTRSSVNQGHGPVDHLYNSCPMGFLSQAKLLTADIEEQIEQMAFITKLADGTLEPQVFAKYLQQDNLYLEEYGKFFQRGADLVSDKLVSSKAEKRFLLEVLGADMQAEITMHNQWLTNNGYSLENALPSEVTSRYLEHLNVAVGSNSYQKFWASAMPCIYLYYRICEKLQSQKTVLNNPYQKWIDLYSSDDYCKIVKQSENYFNQAMKGISTQEQEELLQIYRQSAQYEFDFFNVLP